MNLWGQELPTQKKIFACNQVITIQLPVYIFQLTLRDLLKETEFETEQIRSNHVNWVITRCCQIQDIFSLPPPCGIYKFHVRPETIATDYVNTQMYLALKIIMVREENFPHPKF